MIGKYNLLEKNLYRRMFNNTEQLPKEETQKELVLDEKSLLTETKDIILTKLKLVSFVFVLLPLIPNFSIIFNLK